MSAFFSLVILGLYRERNLEPVLAEDIDAKPHVRAPAVQVHAKLDVGDANISVIFLASHSEQENRIPGGDFRGLFAAKENSSSSPYDIEQISLLSNTKEEGSVIFTWYGQEKSPFCIITGFFYILF